MKTYPRGIICLGSHFNVTRLPWDNPNIRAMRVAFDWVELQPERARFDWSPLDYALGIAAANKVPMALTVSAGLKSPQWVYQAGAQSYTFVSPEADQGTMPLPWDITYLRLWRTFVAKVAEQCDVHPWLAYVQMQGYGKSGELYVATTEPDSTNLLALGGETEWLSAAKSNARNYVRSFAQTPSYIAFSRPFLGKVGQGMMAEFSGWVHANFPGRIGFMCNSLSTRSDTGYPPNKYVNDYNPSGFQMVSGSSDPRVGDVPQAIDNGIDMGADFIEVYRMDILRPEFQSTFAAANVRLGVA